MIIYDTLNYVSGIVCVKSKFLLRFLLPPEVLISNLLTTDLINTGLSRMMYILLEGVRTNK